MTAAADGARRIALIVEYDGAAYMGFQLQAKQPTIQGELEKALRQFTGAPARVRPASRTDSGAHATGQVVDFATSCLHPAERFPQALNFYLPPDIRVQQAYEMRWDFHSRKDASSRVYRYCVLNRAWPSPLLRGHYHWAREPLDAERMARAARLLVGEHDFRPLAGVYPLEVNTARRVFRWDVARRGDEIIFECEATGFLRHQIRRANGILTEIGKGRWPEQALADLLAGSGAEIAERPSLPAHGLCLVQVNYPDFWSKVIA